MDPAQLDTVANFLMEAGAPGVEVRDLPGGAELVAYFADNPPVAALRAWFKDLGWPTDTISTHRRGDEAWAERWKQHCRPQRIGRQLYVCPSWDHRAIPPGRVPIIIDPGMAFGTGDHPTTRNCLRFAERALLARPGARVLDYGTGSGILAIAAAKLGAQEVWGIDNDPVACDVAAANADQNGVRERVHIAGLLPVQPALFELVLANLYADLLAGLASPLAQLLAPDACLVCAGFLLADADRVERAFAAAGLSRAARIEEDGWVILQLHATRATCLPRSS